MGIYNIEATHANRRKMNIVCTCIYAAIIAVFCIGYSNSGSLNIGNWLYAMLVLFGTNVAYCIYMIMIEMRKRKKMLELMTGGDMLPYVRYARASVFALFFSTLTMPFAILSTTLLYIIGPLALLSILFFNLSFVALGYNYVPTEELLDKEAEECAAIANEETENGGGKHFWNAQMGWMQSLLIIKKYYSRSLRSVRKPSRRSSTSGVLIWATKTPQ